MGAVAVGVAIGAVVGGAAAAIQSGGDFNAIWKGALVGAVGGAVGGAFVGWAAPALAPTIGMTGVAALGGGIGGMVAGVGNVALNGGTGDDYLRQGLMGGAMGAATGGLMEASGANAALGEAFGTAPNAPTATPTEAGVPGTVGTQGVTTGEVGVTPTAESLSPGAAPVGTGTEATSGNVFQSSPTQGTPTLNDMYAANATGTMTDAIGDSAIPYKMPGSYEAPTGFGVETGFSGTPKFGGSDVGFGSFGSAPIADASPAGGYFNVDTATGSYGPNGELLGNWDANLGSYTNPAYANQETGLASYGSKGELQGIWDNSQNMYSNQPGFKAGEGMLNPPDNGWSMDKLFSWDTAKDIGKGLAMTTGGKSLLGGLLKASQIPNARNAASANNAQLMDLYNLQKQGYQQQMAQQQADAARNQQIYEQNKAAFQNNVETQAANRALLNEQQANAANYNKQLSETYSNPNAYLSSPEAQAARSMAMQKLLAQQSAAGRRSAGLGLQNQLMMNQLSNLGQYRQGLNSAIRYPGYLSGIQGMSYAPQTQASSAGMLNTLEMANRWNPDYQSALGLGSIFS